jgi:hypothetical protein
MHINRAIYYFQGKSAIIFSKTVLGTGKAYICVYIFIFPKMHIQVLKFMKTTGKHTSQQTDHDREAASQEL